MIRILLEIPDRHLSRAKYTIGVLARRWGVPVRVLGAPEDSPIDVVYGTRLPERYANALHLPFDAEAWRDGTSYRLDRERDIWTDAKPTEQSDPCAAAFHLLTFAYESGVDATRRDRRGVFTVDALPEQRRAAVHRPLVDEIADHLLERIRRATGRSLRGRPAWPSGKRYAICLTHDTDAVILGAYGELATNLAKFVLRRQRSHFEMVRDGLRYLGRPNENPLFGFPGWRRFTDDRGIRSCFYLFVQDPVARRDVNDCKSTVFDPRVDWEGLRALASDGWEIGLHPAINAKRSVDSFIAGKRLVEDRLGTPIFGLRHHYWALNWNKPHLTYRKHVNAGFRYDTSIAWRDAAGFRAGTCFPYRPFDIPRDKPIDLEIVPTCLMDSHIVGDSVTVDEAVDRGVRTIETVKRLGGVAVLNWHTESYCNRYKYRRYRDVLSRILEAYLGDGQAWFTTPWELVRRWRRASP